MKLTDFSKQERKWDTYKAFHAHVDHGGHFVQFETGELMTTKYRWKPYQRRFYSELNVEVFSPRDKKVNLKTPDGRKAPAAWLLNSGCAPTLLLDRDSGRVVRLGWSSENREVRPKHLQYATAFFTSEKALPHSDLPIKLTTPKPYEPEHKKWLKELRRICKVYAKLQTDDTLYSGWKFRTERLDQDFELGTGVDVVFANLTETDRMQIATAGYETRYQSEEVPYLELVRE